MTLTTHKVTFGINSCKETQTLKLFPGRKGLETYKIMVVPECAFLKCALSHTRINLIILNI